MWETHLYQAERHVALGEKHLARQQKIVVGLELDGHDATEARRFLRQLQELLALHVAHRDRIRNELGVSYPSRQDFRLTAPPDSGREQTSTDFEVNGAERRARPS